MMAADHFLLHHHCFSSVCREIKSHGLVGLTPPQRTNPEAGRNECNLLFFSTVIAAISNMYHNSSSTDPGPIADYMKAFHKVR